MIGGLLGACAVPMTAAAVCSVVEKPEAVRTWVVDARAAAGGSGALGEPFSRLGEAQLSSAPGDRIVVLDGDYDEGIELKPGQQLLGRGAASEEIDGVDLPAARAPRVGATSQAGVTLADGCVVRGLVVRGDPPIFGRGIEGVVIEDLRTTGGATGGVVLERVRGPVSISRIETLDSSVHGLSVTVDDQAAVELTIRGSTFVGHRSAGIDIRTGQGGQVLLEGNTIDGNALGLVVAHSGGDGELHAEILDNVINGRFGGSHTAVQVFLAGESNKGSFLEAVLRGNFIGSEDLPDSGSQQGQGVEVYASGAGRLRAELTDNTVRAIGNGSALRIVSSTHIGVLDVFLAGNDCSVRPSGGFPLAGLELVAGTTPGDRGILRVEFKDNRAFVGGADGAGLTLSTIAGKPSVELVGYRGAVNDRSAVEAFLNTSATTVSPSSLGQSSITAGTVSGRQASSGRP